MKAKVYVEGREIEFDGSISEVMESLLDILEYTKEPTSESNFTTRNDWIDILYSAFLYQIDIDFYGFKTRIIEYSADSMYKSKYVRHTFNFSDGNKITLEKSL